jgi:hypothetical protein
MEQPAEDQAISRLAAFIGEWRMEAMFKDIPATDSGASVVFECLRGEKFLIERWEVRFRRRPMASRLSVPIPKTTATTSSTTLTRAASPAFTR